MSIYMAGLPGNSSSCAQTARFNVEQGPAAVEHAHNTCSRPGVAQVRCYATLVQIEILVLHNCCITVAQLQLLVLHNCCTTIAQLLHNCCIAVAQLAHSSY